MVFLLHEVPWFQRANNSKLCNPDFLITCRLLCPKFLSLTTAKQTPDTLGSSLGSPRRCKLLPYTKPDPNPAWLCHGPHSTAAQLASQIGPGPCHCTLHLPQSYKTHIVSCALRPAQKGSPILIGWAGASPGQPQPSAVKK